MIAVTRIKDLSLLLEAPERLGVDDTIAVTLIVRAVGVPGLRVFATFGVLVSGRVGGEIHTQSISHKG